MKTIKEYPIVKGHRPSIMQAESCDGMGDGYIVFFSCLANPLVSAWTDCVPTFEEAKKTMVSIIEEATR